MLTVLQKHLCGLALASNILLHHQSTNQLAVSAVGNTMAISQACAWVLESRALEKLDRKKHTRDICTVLAREQGGSTAGQHLWQPRCNLCPIVGWLHSVCTNVLATMRHRISAGRAVRCDASAQSAGIRDPLIDDVKPAGYLSISIWHMLSPECGYFQRICNQDTQRLQRLHITSSVRACNGPKG